MAAATAPLPALFEIPGRRFNPVALSVCWSPDPHHGQAKSLLEVFLGIFGHTCRT